MRVDLMKLSCQLIYINKFQNDIDLLMTPTKFRSSYMNIENWGVEPNFN